MNTLRHLLIAAAACWVSFRASLVLAALSGRLEAASMARPHPQWVCPTCGAEEVDAVMGRAHTSLRHERAPVDVVDRH